MNNIISYEIVKKKLAFQTKPTKSDTFWTLSLDSKFNMYFLFNYTKLSPAMLTRAITTRQKIMELLEVQFSRKIFVLVINSQLHTS